MARDSRIICRFAASTSFVRSADERLPMSAAMHWLMICLLFLHKALIPLNFFPRAL